MYFSTREKQILSLLLDYPAGVKLEKLQDVLQVSRRTIYREISSLEKTLKEKDLQIIKPRGKGYRLVGSQEDLESLQKDLIQKKDYLFTNSIQRQGAIVCLLLITDEIRKIESFAIDFQVSTATLISDLESIEKSLWDYQLKLERHKGQGICIEGPERQRRQLLSNLIYNGISEVEFFQFMDELGEDYPKAENFFLKLLTPSSLHLSQQIFQEVFSQKFKKVTDNQLQRIVILLAVSIDRMSHGHWIDSNARHSAAPEMISMAGQMMIKVAIEVKHSIPTTEVRFLAEQLEGVNYKEPQNIFIDNYDVELSYKTRELIKLVSQDADIDFRGDEQLFTDLFAHLSAALKRNTEISESKPLLDKIRGKYQRLTEAVMKDLPQIFPKTTFSSDELGYIIIHFATAIERNPNTKLFSALVLCSSGVGTARILESRLRKYVPEINHIQVAKISEMSQLNYRDYDLILSTVFLPGFKLPYKVISPLLLEDEIKELKQYVELLQPRIATNNQFKEGKEGNEASEEFDEIYATMRIANQLLQNFNIEPISAGDTIEQTITDIIATLKGVIVSDEKAVTEKVINRYRIAPIGIPKTNFALFHCADSHIKTPFFSIYDLDQSFIVQGMDKKEMPLTRVLLLLAPEPISEVQQKLLSAISSSIIESDLNTEIYKFGNKEIVYQLLTGLFVDDVRGL